MLSSNSENMLSGRPFFKWETIYRGSQFVSLKCFQVESSIFLLDMGNMGENYPFALAFQFLIPEVWAPQFSP